MTPSTAVFDACVLYPAPLRDLLMQLALTDLVRARWTDRIHEEWIRSVLANRGDLTRDQLERTRNLMDSHVRDALVEGYERLIDGLSLPDPGDRHVLAAAIRCGASVIVTFNLGDFPAVALGAHGVVAFHPDAFVANLFDLAPAAVCSAVKTVRNRLRNPPVGVVDYLATLKRQGLRETVARLTDHADRL